MASKQSEPGATSLGATAMGSHAAGTTATGAVRSGGGAVPTRRPAGKEPLPAQATRAGLDFVDDRLSSAKWIRVQLNKVFPDHWSFLLGEITLYSFIILILTGIFLTFFYNASLSEVVYQGNYIPLRGVTMTEAFASTLHITFDIRGGLLIRQIHHWSALLFLSAMIVHLCRIFFTGAFRKPRELNWVIGVTLLILGILEGFAGYSLPDDLLSGTGLRIAFSIVESIPLVGTWAGFLLFGSNFPGTDFIPRLFVVHILLIPLALFGLIGAHLALLWHQKHTDFPGPGKTERNVIGTRVWPGFAFKSQGFMLLVFGALALLGGFAQINPIWLYGPYDPSQVSAGSQPDWYMGFLDGALRIMPNIETNLLGHTISWNILIPSVVMPGIVFTGMILYPFLEAWVTGDRAHHNLLDRPRNRPGRTSLGIMSLSFYVVLLLAGGNDLLAVTFGLSIQQLIWIFRICFFVVPPIAYFISYRLCLALQRSEEEVEHHGVETGTILRSPSGEYTEVHAPKPPQELPPLVGVNGYVVNREHQGQLTDGNGHRSRTAGTALARIGRGIGGFFTERQDRATSADDPEPPKTLTRR